LSLTVVLVSLATAVIVVMITLIISHRMAGPVYRLKKEINLLKEGSLKRDFSVRENDHFKDLAQALQEMTNTLHERHSRLKESCQALSALLKKEAPDKDKLKKLLDEFQENSNYFKL
jgi:nitrogen fixation/metabolism regulation signal transduction histidine kinase